MPHKSTFETKFRRRREGKTDFAKRLEMLKSKKPRLVVRGSNKNYTAQLVKFNPKGDETLASAVSKELGKYGWKAANSNLPAAYLTAFLCAKKGIQKGVKEAVLDVGLASTVKASRCFAALKGALDAGLQVKASEKAFPSIERISGKHIADFASKLGEEELGKKFAEYFKNNIDPKELPGLFENARKAIEEKFKQKVN